MPEGARLSPLAPQFYGVPLVDSASIAVKLAEMLVDFKKAEIPWISRKGAYSRPEEEISVEAFRKIEYHFGGVI